MFEDPSFFVSLSFVFFCLAVYFGQGKKISSMLRQQIVSRLDPLHQAEQSFHSLSDAWHHAKHRIDHVSHEIQDIHNYYEGVLKQSLEKAQLREKAWIEFRDREIKTFQFLQKKKANEKALANILNEFIDESN